MTDAESRKLRVAHPIEAQRATFPQGGATPSATPSATGSLKALARLALQANKAQPSAQPTSNSGRNQAQLEAVKTPAKVAPVAATPSAVPTPAQAASRRLSQIEQAGLALLVKVADGFVVWASTQARIPDEWAEYPVFTTEELRLIPLGDRQAARFWLEAKRTFPGSTWHPVSETATPTSPPSPEHVTCGTCKHFQAGEHGGMGDCAMHADQRTTPPSERYPAGYPLQAALWPDAKRHCRDWRSSQGDHHGKIQQENRCAESEPGKSGCPDRPGG